MQPGTSLTKGNQPSRRTPTTEATSHQQKETGRKTNPTFFLLMLNGSRFPEGSEMTSTSLSLHRTSNDLWQQGTAATMSYDWRASLPAVCIPQQQTRVECQSRQNISGCVKLPTCASNARSLSAEITTSTKNQTGSSRCTAELGQRTSPRFRHFVFFLPVIGYP